MLDYFIINNAESPQFRHFKGPDLGAPC
ncbi:MAG: hypothetical protein ACI9K1_000907, partial [Arcticibacterium sp.]